MSPFSVIFNSLPNDKILDWPKLKAFADNNLYVAKMMISLYDGAENIVEKKEENSGYQHFLLFPQCFWTGFLHRVVKIRDCVVKS